MATLRVVSLLPSATETLAAILGGVRGGGGGRAVELIGRSHECDWAGSAEATAELARLPVLTGQRVQPASSAEIDEAVRAQLAGGESLYTLNTALLRDLKPDVILTQDLCRVCSIDLNTVRGVVNGFPADARPRVISLNPQTFEAVLDDLLTVGEAVDLESQALKAVTSLRSRILRAEELVTPYAAGPTVAFLEWTDPIYIGGHWTPQLIERAGGVHPLNPTTAADGSGAASGPIGQTMRTAGKSVRIPEEVLAASRPEALVVCPCGLNLDRAWAETELLARKPWWRELPAVRSGRVAVVDGNQFFNRPGPRLVDAFEWLVAWLNDRPEAMPHPHAPHQFAWRAWRS